MRNKTLIVSLLLIFILIFIGYKKFFNGYLTSKFYESQIPKNITQTGAILTTPSLEEDSKSNQLYNLLDRGIITTKEFILTPYPKNRMFEVKLLEPMETNKTIFKQWLIENGYESINSSKFVFID